MLSCIDASILKWYSGALVLFRLSAIFIIIIIIILIPAMND